MTNPSKIGLITGLSAAIAWAGFGLALAFGSSSPLLQPLMSQLLHPFLGAALPDPASARLLEFVYGVLGAVMVSWSVLFAALFWHVQKHRSDWAWWACLGALLAWFGMDEGFSIYFGVTLNVVGNLVLLAWLGLALVIVKPRHQK